MSSIAANPASEELPAFGLHYDAWGQLVLIDAEGVRHVGITPLRMFPFSDPQHWLSLTADGREILCIENPQQLAPAVREILEAELSRREFVPVIQRIVSVSSILEPCQWVVETDRGRTSFILKTEDDVRHLGQNKALILDSAGIRYLIPNIKTLNAASRRVLERYV